MKFYAQCSFLLLSLPGLASAVLNCRPEGPVVPKPSLIDSPVFKAAATNLTRILDDAVAETIAAGWAVENVSFSLAVVSLDQKDPGVPIWEYHHRAEKNEKGTKNITRDSQYLIGSISKVISDYALLKSGVDVDRPVTDFIPKLQSSESEIHWKDISLWMLASQLAGAPANYGFSEYYFLKEVFLKSGFPLLKDSDYPPCGVIGLNKGCSKDQIIDGMLNQHPITAPMERPAYSNIAFTIFVMALEEATGKNYTQMIDDFVVKPLDMQNTLPSPGDDDKAVIPPGESSWGSDYGLNAPGGGLVSTLSDLSKFSFGLLNRSLDLTPTQIRQWLKPEAYIGAYSAVGMPWEIFRPHNITPAHPHPVAIYGKGGGAQLYSSQVNIIDEYGLGLIMLSAGNMGASIYLSDALLATFVPAADTAARDQAEENYARTFKSGCDTPKNMSYEASFTLDNDSLTISSIKSNGKDMFEDIKKIWGMTMGQYTASFGSTVRLFPVELAERVTLNGKTAIKEIWRLWPEFGGAPPKSDLPGALLEMDNCVIWSVGDWVHYGQDPMDRVVFYKDDKGHVIGFEMPFLRSGVMHPA